MKFYADFGPRRTRQIIADVVAVMVIIAAIAIGVVVRDAIAAVGAVFIKLEDAGKGFESTMTDAGDKLGGVPLIGDGIKVPFEQASGAGQVLADAARTGQATVDSLATLTGVVVAVAPILMIVLIWLVPRLLFVRRSGAVRALARLSGGEKVLALRALGRVSALEIAKVSDDPLAGIVANDHAVIRGLAALEARAVGVNLARP